MNFEKFRHIIWKQKAAGYDGFEGLVAKLLERLTGQRFHLSLSGRQEGRDMASNSLMVECKRHDDSTSLKSDELLTKFAASTLNGLKPDLWMVVTTKRLGEQHHNQLQLFSQDHGVAYFSIDAQDDEHSFLAALCAYEPEITIRHLEESCENLKENNKYFTNISEADEHARTLTNEFASYLQALKANQEVVDNAKKLKQELSQQNIGYAHWQSEQNSWLSERLQDKGKSRAAFAQNLAVRAEEQFFIRRKAAQKALDNWFANWSEQHNFFVLLGEEGDGKTWAVADWLSGKLSADFPIIFLPSGMAACNEPEILLPEIIAKQLREPYEGYWQKRLQRWQERPAGDTPLFLLVMDGLNERPDMEWRQLLAKFTVEPWCNHVAVLLTCRKTFWNEHLSSVESAVFTLGPYNDAELQQALAERDLTRQDFDTNLIDLLRVPRYFDLTVRLRKKIGSEGEVTRERLIYEDWRDKIGRKLNKSLSHESFQILISDLSDRLRKSEKKRISQSELTTELSSYEDSDSLLTELSSGRILDRHRNGWKVNPDYLVLGLGLLLAYEVADAEEDGQDLTEVIDHFQEPQPDMDLKVSICAMALYHALGEKEWPEEIHLALFNAWVSGRNIQEDDWWRITAYLPVRPEVYLRMMEQVRLSDTDHLYLGDTLKARFLQFGRRDTVQQALITAFERWMGFVHPDGRGRLFNDEKALEEDRQRVQEALGEHFSGELFGYKLTITDNKELLRLSRLMLAIISAHERTPYLRAIVTGIVAGTIMGFPDFADDLSWVLRTTKDNIERSLMQEAEKLLEIQHPVAQKAAWWLLNSLSTEKAWQLRDAIPAEYQWVSPSWKLALENPCKYYLFSEENYLDCIEKLRDEPDRIVSHLSSVALNPVCGVPDNIRPIFMNTFTLVSLKKIRSAPDGGQNHEDIQLSNIEPALCAYCPERLAEIINELACQLPNRSGMALRSLSYLIYEHILTLDDTSHEAVDHAWRNSLANAEDENSRVAEDVLFPCVLRGRPLEQQLDSLEKRGEKCGHFQNYPPFLKKLEISSKPSLLVEKLKKISSDTQLHNFLSTLTSSAAELDEQVMDLLPEFSEIDNSFTRSYALELIFRSKNKQAIQSFLKSDWTSEGVKNNGERHWGSCLLAEYGQDLSFAEISRRVSTDLIGYSIKKRGFKPKEVAAYGKILNQSMPERYIQPDILAQVVSCCPEYVDQWMDAKLRSERIWRHQGFYVSLCEALLDQQPKKGKQLFWWLDAHNHYRRFEGKAVSFQATGSPEVHSIRRDLLNRVVTDDGLFEIVFLAQKYGRHEWLDETITAYLNSNFALDTAKGLFLLGFMDDSSAGEQLDTWIAEKQPSWLHSCAQQATIIHKRNQWAHHWFKRFVTHKETLQAWAAFRLFLRCVDRRFWLWGEKMIYSQNVPYERFEHYRTCRDFIVKATKKNEEKAPFELEKCLVGCRVRKKQLWPWLGSYLQEELGS